MTVTVTHLSDATGWLPTQRSAIARVTDSTAGATTTGMVMVLEQVADAAVGAAARRSPLRRSALAAAAATTANTATTTATLTTRRRLRPRLPYEGPLARRAVCLPAIARRSSSVI
ncbi:MAG: hypothetical protein ABJB98_10690 [Actinomycetota bacterium]